VHALSRPVEPGRDGTTLHQPVFQVQPSRDGWAAHGSCPARGRMTGARYGTTRPRSCGRRAGPNYAVIRPGREPAPRTRAQTVSGISSRIRRSRYDRG